MEQSLLPDKFEHGYMETYKGGYKFTPETYLAQVLAHSATSLENSLFQGQDFFGLGLFLEEANTSDPNGSLCDEQISSTFFATVFKLDSDNIPARPATLEQPFFPLTQDPQLSPNETGVLFLKGYASPRSLLELGAAYSIDPELFRRHLQFVQPVSAMFKPVLLPSAQSSIIQLSVTTVGRHVTPQYTSLQDKRRRVAADMATYLKGLARGLENAKDIWFLPTTLYKSRVALKKHRYPGYDPQRISSERAAQSISLLPLAFGQSLNTKVMREDPFYALSELFNFVAASEMQFLTAVERHLDLDPSQLQGYFDQPFLNGHANLIFFRNLMEDHVNNITETYTFIRNRSILKWPRSNSNLAQRAALQLEIDFEALLERARLMRDRSEREMNVLISKTQLAEIERGTVKTKKVRTLILLATVFLPGTATATIFSMNFVRFEPAWQGILLWILLTALLTVICFIAVSWDEGPLLRLRERKLHMA
ncbi:MAG: hypothetical protein Q9220_006928 [cf. Caloplaca sp. 1 TL-2023]